MLVTMGSAESDHLPDYGQDSLQLKIQRRTPITKAGRDSLLEKKRKEKKKRKEEKN